MYFFSNHNWYADPANILNVCVTTTIVPEIFDRKDVRFTHPSKKTYCKENGEKYLMSFMTMDNDVRVKFLSNADVAGNRVYDNLIDFFVWLFSFHMEICLA